MKTAITIFSLVLSGCCAISTQGKFEGERDYWVGQRLSDPFYEMFVEQAKSYREHSGEKIEYRYAKAECEYAVVINSQTRIVESWSYISSPEKCAMSNCGAW